MQQGFKLAFFGNVHGNLPGLNAALTDMAQQGAEAYLCLEDRRRVARRMHPTDHGAGMGRRLSTLKVRPPNLVG